MGSSEIRSVSAVERACRRGCDREGANRIGKITPRMARRSAAGRRGGRPARDRCSAEAGRLSRRRRSGSGWRRRRRPGREEERESAAWDTPRAREMEMDRVCYQMQEQRPRRGGSDRTRRKSRGLVPTRASVDPCAGTAITAPGGLTGARTIEIRTRSTGADPDWVPPGSTSPLPTIRRCRRGSALLDVSPGKAGRFRARSSHRMT